MESNFVQLMKNSKAINKNLPQIKMAILGDCSTQHLSMAIKGAAYEKGLNVDVYDAAYDQISIEVIDNNSHMYQYNPDFVLIFMCSEKLYERYCLCSINERSNFAVQEYQVILYYWNTINKRIGAKIFQIGFVEINDGVFGNYAYKLQSSFIYQVRKLNYLLMQEISGRNYIYWDDLQYIQSCVGKNLFTDKNMYYMAKITLTLDVIARLAENIIQMIVALRGNIVKCVILDLDGTLWGGVIGDDGNSGIQIGEIGEGAIYTEFQKWLKELKNRGILLAVCSKNDEAVAKEPFLHNSEMILKLDDFAAFIANWDDKASNIIKIQETLNINMESIVFIDDNIFERNYVSQMIPECNVVDLPDNPASYLEYIKDLNLFEMVSYSDEDSLRTQRYHEETKRIHIQKQFSSYKEYLKSLDMKAKAKSFDKFYFSRIAQLTQRSNQFNLRTIRYSESDIERILMDDNFITFYFTLRDKCGEQGLISVVILQKKNPKTLFIDTWLMSCRVLKRSMESYVLNVIMKFAKDNNYRIVVGEYIKTSKNSMVESLYKDFGFVSIGDNYYEIKVDEYLEKETFVKEEI